MALQNECWRRVGYVEITDENGTHVYGGSQDSLDFKFNGTKIGDVCPKFTVSILGLSLKTISGITVYNPSEAMKRRMTVRVFAGYGDDALRKEIFNGTVFEAIPTSPPDMWLNISCIHNAVSLNSVPDEDNYALTNQTQKRIAQNIASVCGLELVVDDSVDEKVFDKEKKYSFEISGRISMLPKRFGATFGYRVIVDDGIMLVSAKEPWIYNVSNAKQISLKTGMIEIPKVSVQGANIKMRLNDSFDIGSWVHLESEMIPKANEDYYTIRKTHTGHFRGDEWFTELECYRHGYRRQ